jgi:RND superfamily putative drug exporter
MGKPMLTVRIARWSAEHPWRAIGAWLLFVAICIGAGQVTGTKSADFDDNPTGELATYKSIVDESGFTHPATENVLISAKTGKIDQDRATAAADDVRARMDALPEVGKISDPVPSPKGTAVLVNVALTGDPETSEERVDALLDATAAVQKQYPDLRIEEVGGSSLDKALSAALGDDFQKAELISIPVTLIIMLVVFGALIAAGVPVLLAMSAVGAALGLSALASQLIPATDNTSSMVLLIGMAVGVDYSLFYVRRDREERARGAGHLDAVEIAAATSGHAIVVSGIAVTVAMAGMFVVNDIVFSSIAVGTILVVLTAMIGSITVLPALLAKLGRFVDKPKIPILWRLSMRNNDNPRFWRAVLKPSLRAPKTTLIIGGGLLAALAVPAFSMTLNSPGESDLPRSIPIMRSYDRMTEAFPSTGASHEIAVRVPASQATQGKAAVDQLVAQLGAEPGFAHDQPPEVNTAANGRIYLISAGIPYDGASAEADQSLTQLRTVLLPATIGSVQGAEFAVSGQTAGENDFVGSMKDALPWVIGFVLLLTFLVMLWAFRAPVIALSAIGLNLLSAGAAYGLLVLVFQQTWAEGLLGFTSTGGITAWLPVILFVTLFGLSMDYHVFVVSRIREASALMPTRDAIASGITKSAGVVTSAAAVMIGVFSIFATLSTIDMKQMGVGLAAAILIDATLIRAVLLPALMTVLGKANWWAPRWLRPRTETNANEETRVLEPVG